MNKIVIDNIRKVFKENMLLWASKQQDKVKRACTIHELTTFLIQSDFVEDLALLITSGDLDVALPDLEEPEEEE